VDDLSNKGLASIAIRFFYVARQDATIALCFQHLGEHDHAGSGSTPVESLPITHGFSFTFAGHQLGVYTDKQGIRLCATCRPPFGSRSKWQ
jgi:hypothetical protein